MSEITSDIFRVRSRWLAE